MGSDKKGFFFWGLGGAKETCRVDNPKKKIGTTNGHEFSKSYE
jgi:hypothetical protein